MFRPKDRWKKRFESFFILLSLLVQVCGTSTVISPISVVAQEIVPSLPSPLSFSTISINNISGSEGSQTQLLSPGQSTSSQSSITSFSSLLPKQSSRKVKQFYGGVSIDKIPVVKKSKILRRERQEFRYCLGVILKEQTEDEKKGSETHWQDHYYSVQQFLHIMDFNLEMATHLQESLGVSSAKIKEYFTKKYSEEEREDICVGLEDLLELNIHFLLPSLANEVSAAAVGGKKCVIDKNARPEPLAAYPYSPSATSRGEYPLIQEDHRSGGVVREFERNWKSADLNIKDLLEVDDVSEFIKEGYRFLFHFEMISKVRSKSADLSHNEINPDEWFQSGVLKLNPGANVAVQQPAAVPVPVSVPAFADVKATASKEENKSGSFQTLHRPQSSRISRLSFSQWQAIQKAHWLHKKNAIEKLFKKEPAADSAKEPSRFSSFFKRKANAISRQLEKLFFLRKLRQNEEEKIEELEKHKAEAQVQLQEMQEEFGIEAPYVPKPKVYRKTAKMLFYYNRFFTDTVVDYSLEKGMKANIGMWMPMSGQRYNMYKFAKFMDGATVLTTTVVGLALIPVTGGLSVPVAFGVGVFSTVGYSLLTSASRKEPLDMTITKAGVRLGHATVEGLIPGVGQVNAFFTSTDDIRLASRIDQRLYKVISGSKAPIKVRPESLGVPLVLPLMRERLEYLSQGLLPVGMKLYKAHKRKLNEKQIEELRTLLTKLSAAKMELMTSLTKAKLRYTKLLIQHRVPQGVKDDIVHYLEMDDMAELKLEAIEEIKDSER